MAFLTIFSLILIGPLSIHCSNQAITAQDPQMLFNEAEEAIQNSHYQIALESLRTLKNKYPYSPLSTLAQLRIADVYFLQESFIEAAASYQVFRELHPQHPQTQYALLKEAQSYFKLFPRNTARDLSDAQKALKLFLEFQNLYPHSPELKTVTDSIAVIHTLLAEKQMNIGNFYYKRKFFEAAQQRYQKILDLYPETPFAQLAQEKMRKIHEIMNLK